MALSIPSHYTINVAAVTDFWRKPPSVNSFNAPTHLVSINSTEFHRARVTVSADWTRLYDQGGLFIYFPESESTKTKRFWLKSGIEYFHDKPNLSTVASREWSDWSLNEISGKEVTVEVVREEVDVKNGKGSSLFVYEVVGGVRSEGPVREVTWAFEKEGEMKVGVYAARPTAQGEHDHEELKVTFKDFQLD
ncbi:hypothetical protein K474DRAFT_1610163 [Panus rudis PR-1116 ss-1]|nr:hypothetical protein K474DRAFT_1610163 [Panus rudis PR-1116 ss-1]